MSIARKLAELRQKIESECDLARRDIAEITLIAVSKTVEDSKIQEAYDCRQRHFGESRLQEAIPKIEALPKDIVWHFIGKLQSNKAKRVAQLFDVIHTLESENQLAEISKSGRTIEGFIEVNIAEESQKAGILPDRLDDFIKLALNYPQVQINGLMTIGPVANDLEVTRNCFRTMRNLAARTGVEKLSMGMSHDFGVAIQEGSTHLRIGSAIFGSRY
jgi:pyridoxal phosphate enzyme (YggS family)